MRFFIIFAGLLLTGCATTQPLQVTAPCPKPKMPAPPTDYMAELKPGAKPADFVRACLLTRVSAIYAYQQCAHVCGGYE